MSGTVDSATASISFTQIDANTYQYSISLTNTGTAGIQTFWFAWDDVPDVNFMTAVPTSIGSPSGWFALVTHNFVGSDGYGIQFYTFSPLAGGHTLSGFTFRSSETPAQMFGPSPFEPAFSTLSSFVYPGWPPTIGDPNGANFVVACFAEGTRILTAAGEVAVERLAAGDLVVTRGGRLSAVRWVGHRRVDCRVHRRPASVWPIRVRAGAFGAGMPHRDLVLSPDHAVFVDGVLIPVHLLENGGSVRRERVASVTYWHVELAAHAVLLAEGMPAESYLDTGNRDAFANGGRVVAAAPDFGRSAWDERACAPLALGGAVVAAVRARLAGEIDGGVAVSA